MKLDKKDKKILTISLAAGFLISFIIDKALDITLMGLMLYFSHKYLGNIEFLSEIYDKDKNIDYIDKEEYFRKIKKSLIIIDVYIVTKLLFILTTKLGGFNGLEMLLVFEIITIYSDYLGRKYINTIDGEKLERKIKIANNKILLAILLITFIGYTYNYNNNVIKEDDYIKAGNYEYSLGYDEEGSRIVELSGDGFYQRAAESEENNKHFEQYIKDCKALLSLKNLEKYSKVAMVFMFILAISQMRFKEKNKKANTWALHFCLIGAIIFGTITFNTYSIDLEYKIQMDFAEKHLY